MLKWIAIASVCFSVSKAFKYGVINMMDDQYTIYRSYLGLQALDFVWFLMILIPCRPRKEWP